MVEEDARAKAFHYYNNQFSKSSRSIGKFLRVPFDENATQEDILHAARLAAAGKIGSSTAFSPLLGSRDVPGC